MFFTHSQQKNAFFGDNKNIFGNYIQEGVQFWGKPAKKVNSSLTCQSSPGQIARQIYLFSKEHTY